MTAPSLLFYVSGHGFGHATRVAAVLEALKARRPDLLLHVRTRAPARLFPNAVVSQGELDDGMTQPNALDVDLPATLAAHQSLCRRWVALVAGEAGVVRDLKPRLVVGDIPALGFAAAEAAGVRSAAIGNFSWDWIFSEYARDEPRFDAISRRYAAAYSSAELLLRLPMKCPMPAFRAHADVPLVARRSGLSRDAARERLGLSGEKRPVALVAFGGFPADGVDARGADELSDFIFIGFTPAPAGLRAQWHALPREIPMPLVDLLAAADVAITKPGYGMIAEAAAHGVRLLYVARKGFPEVPALIGYVERLKAGLPLAREDFVAGRWRKGLEEVLRAPAFARVPADGAARAAERLLELAQLC